MASVAPSTQSVLGAATVAVNARSLPRLPQKAPPTTLPPTSSPRLPRRGSPTAGSGQQAPPVVNAGVVTPVGHAGPSFLVELAMPREAEPASKKEKPTGSGEPPPPPTFFGMALASPAWPATVPRIVAVTRDSPAYHAGCLHPGDLVLAVNGVLWDDLGCHVPHDLGRLQEALRPRLLLEVLPAPTPVPPLFGSEETPEQLHARVASVTCGWRARRGMLEAVESTPMTLGSLYGAGPNTPLAMQQMAALASRLALAQQAGAPPMRLLPLTTLRSLRCFPEPASAALVDAATALAYAHAHGLPPMVFFVTAATEDAGSEKDGSGAARPAEVRGDLPGLLADYLCSVCPHSAYLSHAESPLRELCLQALPLYAACCTRHLVLDTPARPAQAWCRAEEAVAYAFMPGGARALFLRPPQASGFEAEDRSGKPQPSLSAGRRSEAWSNGPAKALTRGGRACRLAGALLVSPLVLPLLAVSFFVFDTLLAWVTRPALPGLFRHGNFVGTHRLLQVLRVVAARGDYARSQVRTRRLMDPRKGAIPRREEDAAVIEALCVIAQQTQRNAYWNALQVTGVRGVSILLMLSGVLAAVLVLALLTRFFQDFGLTWQYAPVALVLITPPLFVLAMAADSARFLALGTSSLQTSHARFVVAELGADEQIGATVSEA